MLLLCGQYTGIQAQNWRRILDTPGHEWPRGVLALPDGGCIVVGSVEVASSNQWDITVVRLGATGNIVWQKQIGTPFDDHGEDIEATSDGQFVVAARTYESVAGNFQIRLFKMDPATGNTLWDRSFGGSDSDYPGDLIVLSNGDLAVTGASRVDNTLQMDTTSRAFILRTNATGQTLWFKYYSASNANELLLSIRELSDGNLMAAGGSHVFTDSADILLVKVSAAGDQIFRRSIPYNQGEWLTNIVPLPGGRLLGAGVQQRLGSFSGLYVRFNAEGVPIDTHLAPQRPVFHLTQFAPDSIAVTGGRNAFGGAFFQIADTAGVPGRIKDFYSLNTTIGQAIAAVPGGGFFVLADEAPAILRTSERVIVYKSSANGVTDENFIQGQLVRDDDGNCEPTPGEQPLANWGVQATSSTGQQFFATTDDFGRYTLTVSAETFAVAAVAPSGLWQSCGPFLVDITSNGQTIQQDIAVIAQGEYAALVVDIGTAVLAFGRPNPLNIQLMNRGNMTADGVTVRFSYNPQKARIQSVSLADTLRLAPDTLLFRIPAGALAPEKTYSFTVTMALLTTSNTGQTYQFRADVSAKNDLLEAWQGPVIQVKGSCEDDSVVFRIINRGSDMPQTLEYIVIEDNVMGRAVPFQLPGGGQKTIKLPANGSTWRLIAPQAEGFPNGRFSTNAVEGCAKTPGFSTGFVMQYPESDAAPQTAIFSGRPLENGPPVLKTAWPLGCGEEHRIAPETALEYQIRFPLPDTAQLIQILDTLPAALDPASFVAGAAHQPYGYSIGTTPEGQSVVRFGWIHPQNQVNQEGFVRFRLHQRPNNPPGTVVANRATVYTVTNKQTNNTESSNRIQHLIDTIGCLRMVAVEMPEAVQKQTWKVYPNPAAGWVTIESKYPDIQEADALKIIMTDLAGSIIFETTTAGTTAQLEVGNLLSGLYFIHLTTIDHHKEKRYAPMKLVIQR